MKEHETALQLRILDLHNDLTKSKQEILNLEKIINTQNIQNSADIENHFLVKFVQFFFILEMKPFIT